MRIPQSIVVLLAVIVAGLGSCAIGQAQTGPCPPALTFTANATHACALVNVAEHNEQDPMTHVAKITRYDLLFFDEAVDRTNTANQPIQTSSIGKPALAA